MSSIQPTERIGKLARPAVAIGGFLIAMGMILLSTVVLNIMNVIDTSAFTNEAYLLMLMSALFLVGVLDIIGGLILSRSTDLHRLDQHDLRTATPREGLVNNEKATQAKNTSISWRDGH